MGTFKLSKIDKDQKGERIQKEHIQKQAITASGLNAKFSTDATGALVVTDIDDNVVMYRYVFY